MSVTTDAEQREQFKVAVIALDMRCVASRPPILGEEFSPCDGPLHAHHVISQQQLRKHDLDAFLWDPRVGAAVCERHHRRHHNRSEPLERLMLPKRCQDFAEGLGVERYLDRYYA